MSKKLNDVRGFFERFDHVIQPEPNTGCWLWLAGCVTGRANAGVGYGVITLPHTSKKQRHMYAHRASYEAVHGQGSASGLLVRHSCDMPLCVNPDHLSLGTHKDNGQDMVRHGRSMRGARNHRARLSEAQVLQIFDLYRAGIRQPVIGARFGIGQSAVSRIICGNRWLGAALSQKCATNPLPASLRQSQPHHPFPPSNPKVRLTLPLGTSQARALLAAIDNPGDYLEAASDVQNLRVASRKSKTSPERI